MTYQLLILRRAQKVIGDLPENRRDAIAEVIYALASEPRPHGYKKLAGRDGYRLRVGDYRVVYEIDDRAKQITVLDVGHRRNIYR